MANQPNLDTHKVIVTGLSGAGISSTLKHLEDFGYEVFDNFPVSMVKPLIDDPQSADRMIAIGVDARTRGFDPETILKTSQDISASLIFLTADENVLLKRFTETRRRHPLASDRPVQDGIKKEQELLHPIKKDADIVIDTTELSIHDLRRTLESTFSDEKKHNLSITIMSFGFKHGVPRAADTVFDVRFLKNPHWQKDLRPLTGKDKPVGEYIEQDPHYSDFITSVQGLIEPLLPRYKDEGKSYFTLAIGCTGGKHRSVYTTEKLAPWLEELGYQTNIMHRDIER